MKYSQLLSEAAGKLAMAGISEAKNDAWLLFEYVFGMAKHEYFMKLNNDCSDEGLIARFNQHIDVRCSHVPLQHITGTQDFMGLTFKVNEHVLIPRQDTEVLVEKVLAVIERLAHEKDKADIRVLDMCTGSGCIAISIAKHGGVNVTAVDISEEALSVAGENASALEADKVTFVKSNLFNKLRDNSTGNTCMKYDIIVSNPPYIPSKDIEELMPEVRDFEPRLALDGTEDGLLFYREITKESVDFLNPGGWLMYEIGCEQGEDVKNIMEQNGYLEATVHKDLAGLDRIVVAKIPEGFC